MPNACAVGRRPYAEELRALESIELGKLGAPGIGQAVGLDIEAFTFSLLYQFIAKVLDIV